MEVYDQSGNANNKYKRKNQIKQIRFKASILQPDLCDYSDAYLVAGGTIAVENPNNDAYDKKLTYVNLN